MIALLDYAAALENENKTALDDCRKAVGDN
jgi:hypothetical protein